MKRSSARPTQSPCPLPRSASITVFGASALAAAIATEPSNSETVARNASSNDDPPEIRRDTAVGITLASVVIGSAIFSERRSVISAWLSTSPFNAATRYGAPADAPTSSLFTGCAFGSEIMPTLAQRVCPITETRAPGWLTNSRSKSSLRTASRITRVLSPSSPISAAALYTKDQARVALPTRTEREVNNGSSVRPASNGTTLLSDASISWPQTNTLTPAESRPRTSMRSMAANDC